MAKNAKYYAKIGGTWEQQYFQTKAVQTTMDDPGSGLLNGKTDVQAALNHINAKFGAASGFATLDSGSKIPVAQLPAAVTGGMRFRGTLAIGVGTDIDDVFNVINEVGEYLVVTTGGSLAQGTTYTGVFQAPGDEGDFTLPITLEAGDWIVLTDDSNSGSQEYGFAIINNTYQDATDGVKGIVQLSSETTFANLSGDNVVTDGVLGTVMVTNFAGTGTATTFARSDHSHSIYLQKGGGTMTGNLTLGDGGTNDADLVVSAEDASAAGGSRSNDITFQYKPSGLSAATRDLDVNINGGLEWGGDLVATAANWNVASTATNGIGIPEIFVSTSTPSGGKDGDVWIEYVA